MNREELKDYYDNIIKPALDEYEEKKKLLLENLMLHTINIEDTGLFNYKGKQSTVYNRFNDSNIKSLEDLFLAVDSNTINYGKDNMPTNHNFYIHNEIDGIISLLKFKYLGIYPNNLKELLNYQINFNFNIDINTYSDFGYPGNVLKSINIKTPKYIKEIVESFYKVLKSCGFNQTAVKTLIDIAYKKQLCNTTLGEFISTLDPVQISELLKKVPGEIEPLLNILSIIKDFQEKDNLLNKQNKSIR